MPRCRLLRCRLGSWILVVFSLACRATDVQSRWTFASTPFSSLESSRKHPLTRDVLERLTSALQLLTTPAAAVSIQFAPLETCSCADDAVPTQLELSRRFRGPPVGRSHRSLPVQDPRGCVRKMHLNSIPPEPGEHECFELGCTYPPISVVSNCRILSHVPIML